MDSRLEGVARRERQKISAQPTVRESHRLSLPTPLSRFQHARHCAAHIWIITAAQSQTYHRAALPSAHQTSIDWVHLVPCDAFSQSLIYKEINGLHNNTDPNASVSTGLPHPPTTNYFNATHRQNQEVDNFFQLLTRPSDELYVSDWLGVLS